MSILRAENISFSLEGKILLDSLDLTFQEGELTTIVGPNGAGKSTLIRLLCGENRPSRGTVRFREQDIHSLPPWRLANMRAVMPQAAQLTFPFSVFQVTAIGAAGIGHGLNERQRRGIVSRSLDKADITHLQSRSYQTLSGGEKQRVHFARVLAQLEAGRTIEKKQILFLDEPISSLDLKHQLQLLQEVRTMANRGMCVIAVLHDIQLSASIADRILVLSKGRLVCSGKPKDALTPERIKHIFEVELTSAHLPSSPWKSLSIDDVLEKSG